MEKENKLQNVADDEYGFFVRTTKDKYSTETGEKNDFENWKIGKADKRHCFVVSVTSKMLKTFLINAKDVYLHVECIYSPVKDRTKINKQLKN